MLKKQFFVFTYCGGFKQFNKDFELEAEAIEYAKELKIKKICSFAEVWNCETGKTVFHN